MISQNRPFFRCEYCYVEFFKYGSLLAHKEHYCYKRKPLPRSSTVTTQTLGQECSKNQIVSEGAGSSKNNQTSGSEFVGTLVEQRELWNKRKQLPRSSTVTTQTLGQECSKIVSEGAGSSKSNQTSDSEFVGTLVEQRELSSIKSPYLVGGSNGIPVHDDKVSSTKNEAFGSEFEGILAKTEFDLVKQKELSSTKSPYLVGGSNDIAKNVSTTKFPGRFISKRKLSELESPLMEVAKCLETPIKGVVNVLEAQYDGMETETSSIPNALTENSINTRYYRKDIHPSEVIANQYASVPQVFRDQPFPPLSFSALDFFARYAEGKLHT